jgi:hypothetical protein
VANTTYDIINPVIEMSRSETCLEPNFLDQLNFLSDLKNIIIENFNEYVLGIKEAAEI